VTPEKSSKPIPFYLLFAAIDVYFPNIVLTISAYKF